MSQHTWRKAVVVGVAGLTATLGLAACGDDSDGGSGGDIAVTLITKTDTNPFFVAMAEGAKEAGKEAGRRHHHGGRQGGRRRPTARSLRSRTRSPAATRAS